MGVGWGGEGLGASACPLHLMSMLRSDVSKSLSLKGGQLIDAQQPEEQGRLGTAARKVPDVA